ncbi:MAG: signal peptide peptidase SppA [Planctomycetota bacterium]|nr:signal peptide peptidase SppA [Planctomycetota bacterium]
MTKKAWIAVIVAAALGLGSTANSQTAPASRPASQPGQPLKAGVAQMRLTGTIAERPPDFSWVAAMGAAPATLREWVNRLDAAADDNAVDAVALEIGAPVISWARAAELAHAVRRVAAVKPVYVHLTTGGLPAYLIAAAGTEVTMEPAGELGIYGLAGEMMYFRGALDKLGIGVQFVQIGKFKGASEPFAQSRPSREFEGEMDKLFDGLYDDVCQRLAGYRGIKRAQAQAALDEGPFTAPEALHAKLVDRLASQIDWSKHVERQTFKRTGRERLVWKYSYGRADKPAPDFSNPFALMRILLAGSTRAPLRGPTVAIVHVEGTIVGGAGGTALFGQKLAGARTLVKTIDEMREDDKVRAVVLRINSPGGSALASELIYQALKRCGKAKPVVVSVGDMAASGGYYLAVGGDTVFADPGAIVGSIGVVSGKLNLKGFLEDKLGITTHSITRGRNAGMALMRPWDERELEIVRKQAQTIYDQFVDRVRTGRGARVTKIDDVAQGRLFTASQAKGVGLVDEVGGLKEALALAKKLANLPACDVLVLPRPKRIVDMLADEDDDAEIRSPLSATAAEHLLGRLGGLAEGAGYLLTLTDLFASEHVLTAAPWYVSIRP